MKKTCLLFVASLLSITCPVQAQNASPLDAPESAAWDAKTKSWFVSSLGGGISLAKDGNGWISRFDSEGKLVTAKWVKGLDAPTGLLVSGDDLFAVDRGGLVRISIAKKCVVQKYKLPSDGFLNDVTRAENGDIFVNDMFTNRIYRLGGGGKMELWLESDQLQNPNGIFADGDSLIVAAWGPITDRKTFATQRPGTLLRVRLSDKKIEPLGEGKPIGNLDGVVKWQGRYLATAWGRGELLRVDKRGRAQVVLSGLDGMADLGIDSETGTVAIPCMKDNKLLLLKMCD